MIELVVASLVALVVLLLAMDTLRVSLRSAAIAGEETKLRERQWPVNLLRRDIRRATRLGRESPRWTDGAFTALTDAGVITYRITPDGRLIRSFEPSPGSAVAEADEAIVLHDVTSWRWRSLPGGLIQLELAVRGRTFGGNLHGGSSSRREALTLKRRAGVHPARW